MDEITRQKTIMKTSFLGIAGNVLLVAAKAFVGLIAGSVSIVMDAVNNLTDALSSIITIVGTKLAGKRADKKHPYGYGRIEYLSATVVAMLILFAGVMAIYESILSMIEYFNEGTMPTFEIYSLIIIALAIGVKIGLGLFYKKRAKQTDSETLAASGTDALFDAILSFSTLIGAIAAKFFGLYIEGFLGILIGLFIIKGGLDVMKDALSSVIGNRFDKELLVNIKKDINSVEGVLGCYDLILHSYGHNRNIGAVHVGVKDNLTATQIQGIEREILALIYTKYNTILTVGIYAENFDDEQTKKCYKTVLDVISEYPQVLQIHGFYLDKANALMFFDLVISFDDVTPDETIAKIQDTVQALIPDFKPVILFDQDFSLS